MTPNALIDGIEFRYTLYELDAPARSAIKQLWPIIAPHLDKAVDDILNATGRAPYIKAIITQHRAMIKKLEIEHLKALLSGELDERYFESCRRTVEQEAAIGFDARLRSTAGNFVLRAAIDALAHKHRFSPQKLPKARSSSRRSSPSMSPMP